MDQLQRLLLRNTWSFVDVNYLNVNVREASNIGPNTVGTLLKFRRETSFGDQVFYEKVAACANPEECVKTVSKYFVWEPIPADILRKYTKNSATASAFRKKGNEYFQQKEYENALVFYNLAIMFAPAENQQLGMAYANRSAVLVELKDPEGALEDIGLALQNDYPLASVQKLEQRRAKCEELIATAKNIGNLHEFEVKLELEMRKKLSQDMRRIENPNPSIPVAAKCIQIKFDKSKGRHLVVNRDVAAGTVLVVEDPFVSKLQDGLNWDTKHCHYCLKQIRRGAPCTGCVFVMYCDSTCLLKADEEYHKYECCMMDYLHFGYSQLLPRILFKVGAAELYRIFSTRDSVYFDHKYPFGTEPDCKYDSKSYVAFYHMDKSRVLSPKSQYALTHEALSLATIMEKHTNFFRKIPQDRKNEFKNFVAAVTLNHAKVISCSNWPIGETTKVALADCHPHGNGFESIRKGVKQTATEFNMYAEGCYPLISLMSHSCDSNVHRISDTVNGTQIIIATRALKPGEQVTISFGKTFGNDPYQVRQEDLHQIYGFNCECIACRNKWPMSIQLDPENPIFSCPSCSKKFTEESRGSPEFKKCCLTKLGGWKCGICRKVYSERALELQHNLNMKISQQAEALLAHNHPYEAIMLIEKVSEYFQFHLCPPYSQKYLNESVQEIALRYLFHLSK